MTYRPEIDGLRALAVLPVILFHDTFLEGGYIGVDIFFVIADISFHQLFFLNLVKINFLIEFL